MKRLLVTLMMSAILLVASGACADDLATKDECVTKCHEAAALLSSRSLEDCMNLIGDPLGDFVWKDSYVFLMDLEGKMLAHPIKPELTKKKHVLLETDPLDKALFVHFVNLGRNVGHGWIEYMWPKPGKTTPSKKITYIYRVPDTNLIVGAGVYVAGMMY